jgi:hypothetical protein
MSDKRDVQVQYVYDLSDSERNELTQEFLSTKTIPTCDRFACFEIEGTDPFANIARQVEREVFEDAFGNDPVMLTGEYAPYEESSLFFLAVDIQAKAPAGVMRMIRNSRTGLKTLVDLEDSARTPMTIPTVEVMRHHGIDDLDRCWDGASSAVPRRYRRRLVRLHAQILRTWYLAACRENVQHFVSILDAPVFKVVRDVFGLPVVPLANTPPFTYMDAPNSQPVYAHVSTSLAIAMGGNRKLGQKIRDCCTASTVPEPEHQLER